MFDVHPEFVEALVVPYRLVSHYSATGDTVFLRDAPL